MSDVGHRTTLRCRLGLHSFKIWIGYVPGYGGRFRCARCSQTAVWKD